MAFVSAALVYVECGSRVESIPFIAPSVIFVRSTESTYRCDTAYWAIPSLRTAAVSCSLVCAATDVRQDMAMRKENIFFINIWFERL